MFLVPCGQATIGNRTVIGGGTGLLNLSSPGTSTVWGTASFSLTEAPVHIAYVRKDDPIIRHLGWMG